MLAGGCEHPPAQGVSLSFGSTQDITFPTSPTVRAGPGLPAQRHSSPNQGRKADRKLCMLNFLKLTINGKNSKSCFLWRFSSKITPRTAALTFIRMRKHSFILTSSLSVFIIGIKCLLSGHNASSCRVSHNVNLYN